MDLNFVLNDSPTSPRTADTAFNIGTNTYKFGPVQHAEIPTGFVRQNPASEIPLSLVYSPYHHQTGQYSARSSYSGPSLQSSTAATSPLEISVSAKSLANLNAENQGYSAMNSEDGDASYSRHLPPLNNIHSHPSTTLSVSSEGPSSPHSASRHYHHQNGSDTGYFPPASSHTYPYAQNQQQHYQLPIFSTPQHTRSCGNSLLTLAEAAMETATPGGRKSLEAEAAAEALTGRRASDGALGYCDDIARVARKDQEKAARSTDLGGNMSSRLNNPGSASTQADIKYVSDPSLLLSTVLFVLIYISSPELRPASAGSVTSAGRTVEDETSPINIDGGRSFQLSERSSMDTQTNDLPHNDNAPLFPTPEVSTPRSKPVAISADAGPSTNAAPGPPITPPVTPPSPYDFLNQSPKCSYCNICSTGSPLRKVVSHIFGRNKLSTRQIPKNVWVYYCRKHYQRSRYRNPRGFARQQVLLVKRQCERLQLWGGVKDWVIKVRRREELRMNREGDNGDDLDEVDDELEENTAGEEPEPNDGGPTSGESSRRNSATAATRRRSSTGGNNWIMRHTGTEKTITDIYKLLEKIEVEVQENGGKFPDVELLPNVDLAMAVPIRGSDSDGGGGEGGSGNPGGDENQEGADGDGVAGSKAVKKRRRFDGSGSSGGDEGGSRGSKKTKTTAVKKGGDRKGKGKAPSHAEAVSTDKVSRQSEGTQGFQVAYQRAFSPEVPREHKLEEPIAKVNIFTGTRLENQMATPPSTSVASTGRSTPELNPAFVQIGPSDSFAGSLYCHPPRRSARALPYTGITTMKGYGNYLPTPKSTTEFSPNMLSAITSQSFNELNLRRPDALAFKAITKSNLFDNGNRVRFGQHDGIRI